MRQVHPFLRPAALKDFSAANSALASEEAMLSFAFSLGRLVLSSA